MNKMPEAPLLHRLFGWFRSTDTPVVRPAARHADGDEKPPDAASAQHPREQRAVRRAQLIDLVKEHMTASEIAATAYKFKVLTRDAAGLVFNVLIDVDAAAMASDPQALALHEQALQSLARSRWDMDVQGVYWRFVVGADPVGVAPVAPSEPAPAPFSLPDAAPHRAPEWVRRDFAPTQPMKRPEDDPK